MLWTRGRPSNGDWVWYNTSCTEVLAVQRSSALVSESRMYNDGTIPLVSVVGLIEVLQKDLQLFLEPISCFLFIRPICQLGPLLGLTWCANQLRPSTGCICDATVRHALDYLGLQQLAL